jgi:hypothetical protein
MADLISSDIVLLLGLDSISSNKLFNYSSNLLSHSYKSLLIFAIVNSIVPLNFLSSDDSFFLHFIPNSLYFNSINLYMKLFINFSTCLFSSKLLNYVPIVINIMSNVSQFSSF